MQRYQLVITPVTVHKFEQRCLLCHIQTHGATVKRWFDLVTQASSASSINFHHGFNIAMKMVIHNHDHSPKHRLSHLFLRNCWSVMNFPIPKESMSGTSRAPGDRGASSHGDRAWSLGAPVVTCQGNPGVGTMILQPAVCPFSGLRSSFSDGCFATPPCCF